VLEKSDVCDVNKLIHNTTTIGLVHFQALLNAKNNQQASNHKKVKSNLTADMGVILPHITMHVGGAKRASDLFNCYFDPDPSYNAYEIFVDETITSSAKAESGYGIYYGHANPCNSYYKVYGNNSLQNATLQGIEKVLKTVDHTVNVCIYIDRESVLKVLNKLPLTPQEEHHTTELNMVKRIMHLVNKRQGTTKFRQVYSHLKDGSEAKNTDTIAKHNTLMLEMYGEERANRLIKGNQGADILAGKISQLPPVLAPPINKWHNEFVMKSTRLKCTECGSMLGYVSEQYRDHIKAQIRSEYKYDYTHDKERYADWMNSDKVSQHSWNLLKSLDHKHEKYKNHMLKMLHDALPTKSKIIRHIDKEKEVNLSKGTVKYLWYFKIVYSGNTGKPEILARIFRIL